MSNVTNTDEASILGLLDDYPDVDKRSCQLLGPTALVVQALMGILVILSLVYKRHRESPKRPWRIWLFDVSKQVVGQMFVHGVNVFISDFVSHHTSSNACVYYFLNILIDTTVGVALIYVILHLLTYLFSEKLNLKGFASGVYGNPPSIAFWGRQAALYVLSLTSMKLLVVGLLVLFPGIFKIGEWLLSWTLYGTGDALQVIFTMGIFPIIMNILQFWLIDSIVKASATLEDADSQEDFTHADREPLFRGSLDGDNDDDDFHGISDIENQRNTSRTRTSPEVYPGTKDKGDVTGAFTPEEYKSSASTSVHNDDDHSYPPSLSSSLVSNSSTSSSNKAPREAKNLQKKVKRQAPPTPLNLLSARQRSSEPLQRMEPVSATPRTPSPVIPPDNIKVDPVIDDGWGSSWDDHNWADRPEDNDIGGHKRTLQNIWERD